MQSCPKVEHINNQLIYEKREKFKENICKVIEEPIEPSIQSVFRSIEMVFNGYQLSKFVKIGLSLCHHFVID